MFEAVVSLLINKYLGKYIHNLNSSSLNLSIFNGDVELKGLQLKPEALVELDLPIEVKAGYVGLIKFAIPWTRLFSTSIHVELQDVYVLAGPITDRQYDPELERGLQNAIKRQMLEALQTSAVKNVVNSADENPGFFEKVYTYIINNLQVSIGNIHVRYEDTVTNPDHPFACGVMLKHLRAHTTDSRWQWAQVDSSSTLIHKLLSLEELSVYWNPYVPEQHLLKSRLNTDGWRNLLKTAIDSHQIFEEDFDFIVEPVSAQARVIISKDNNLTMPKFFSDITLQEIEILLSRQQFLNLLSLNDSFKLMRINQRYRKYHPNVPLKISPRSWWQYAYNAIVEEFIRQYSWERIKEHRIKYRKYKELYKKSLEHPDHESIKSKLRELEEGLDVGNILMAREQAKTEFAPERVKKKKKEKGWFSSWFGGSSDEEDVEIKIMKEDGDWLSQLSVEEKNRLYQGIGYDVNAKTFKMSREYIEKKVQVNLKSCCLSLVNYSKKILQISVTQMLGSWETRPAGDASRISCNTESFSIEGTSVEHELVPIVTSDVNVYAPSVNQVFTLDFETNPVYAEADFSLKMNIQPVEVVYDEHSVTEVKAFFQLPAKVNLDMNLVAMETFNQVANKSKIALIYAIEQHKTIHLAVNMKSPYVVIPEFGTLHRGGNVLIVDLGMLQIKSELQPKDVSLEDITMSEIGARLYDQFNVSITDVKVLLADSGDDWHTAQVQPNSQYHILPSMQLNMDFYNTVKPDYKDLPQQKVITNLPRFEINISDKRLHVLYKFFRNFPFPSSTSMITLAEDAVDGANIPRAASILNLRECQLEPSVAQLKRIRRAVLGRHLVDDTKTSTDDETVVRQLSDMADMPRISRDQQEEEDWSSFSEVKPVDDDSSGSNNINILLRFNIREMVVQLNRSFDKLEKPYLMFRADRFHLDAAITAHGVVVHSSLGAVQLVDKMHIGTTGAYMELLSTRADTDLITLTYRKVEPSCPDFLAVYGGVEQGVELCFHSLHILLDQGAVMYMKSFLDGLLASLQIVDMMMSRTSTMVSSLASEVTTQHLTPSPPSSRPEAVVDHPDSKEKQGFIVQLNILAHMRSLSLTLSDNISMVAQLHVRDFHGHLIKRQERLSLSGQLKAIDIRDCCHGALYPNIMTLDDKDDSLINLTFIQYLEKEEQASRDNRLEELALDFRVNVKVGHLQLVAISKFYWELRKFVEPFISKDFMDTATIAMETVSKKVDSIQVSTARFGIMVDMRSPTILVPHKSCSHDLILIDLGDLHIYNVFDITEVNTGGKQEWNHIYIDLVAAQMRRVRLSKDDDDFHVISRIVEPISFKTDIRLTMDPQVSCIQTDISTKLDMVYGNLRKSDIQLMIGILNENWTEGAPQPEPELPVQQHMLHSQPSVESGNGTVIMEDTTNSATHSANKKSAAMVLFSFEGMQLDLYEESQEEKEMGGFAQLNLGKVTGSVSSTSDGEVKVSVSLETLTVTDVREDSKLAVKKILYYDEGNIKSLENIDSSRPLISLIYKIIGDGNTKADIMMERVIINLHIPYLMMVVNFFTDAFTQPEQPNRKPGIAHLHRQVSTVPPSPVPVDPSQPRPVMTVYCTIKQPEIVLFADNESASSHILVINADIALEMVSSSTQQKLLAKVSGLRMFCNIHAAPSNVATKLISPLDLEFSRCFEVNTNELEMNAKLPKFELHLTPANLRLLLDISQMVTQASNQSSFPSKKDLNSQPKTDMWSVEPASTDNWIKMSQEVEKNSSVFDVHQEAPTETFHVAIEEVSAYLEVENLDYILPLLCVRSSLEANASNWTKQLRLKAELHVDVCYYNERLSTWEPFIEPVMEEEGSYLPWELVIQLFQAESYPIVCSYDDNGLDAPDGIQSEVEQMINQNCRHSSSSDVDEEEQVDSPGEMTIIRPKVQKRRIRIASDKSYDSASRHSSIQGESDSESDSLINSIANKLGGIFTSDSSDADISETDDNEDIFDPSLDKPIFLTPRGPVRFSVGPEEFDEVDGPQTVIEPQEDQKNTCNYIIFSSREKLLLNITPHAINVLKDFIESLTKPESSTLHTARHLPAMEINNKLGVDVDILLHPKVKVHPDYVTDCNVYYPGSNSGGNHRDIKENVELEVDGDSEEEDESWDEIDGKLGFKKRGKTIVRFVDKLLTNSGNDLINTGTFVLNEEHNQYTFGGLDKDTMQIKVSGFDPITCVYKKACRRLLTLNPKQSDDNYDQDQVGIRYCLVFDVDVHHSNKTIIVHSPLQLTNHLVMAIDVYCKTDELKKFKPNTQESGEFTKIATVQPQKVCHLPLFIAYNLALYICPSELMYKKCTSPVWWKDLVQTKDRQKFFMCYSQDGQKVFNIKIACEDGEPLQPPQTVPRTIPYFNICFYPPIILHNYLPYDLQYSLEGVTSSSSLTHGEKSPLHTVDLQRSYKLNVGVSDYLGCDWKGALDISQDMEEFKAITMETDADDNANKFLSLNVQFHLSHTWNLYIYSLYWIVNKTDLPIQIRGSLSDTVLECAPSSYPLLFRYKKHKRKKAKLKVFDSNWSHSFSLDTVGNCGVAICKHVQRKRKYMFMVQSQLSNLKLTKIITIMPFFIVVNSCSKPLRYMEENKETDLWFDLAVGQCSPFWPVTENFKMFVKYERSNIVSQHFPIKEAHNTVLRMEHGSALCVEVAGGTQTPFTILFRDYDVGDAPVRVENLCDDVFIKIHQKGQSQTSVLSANQKVLYTWDDPVSERTLMWNVYGRDKPDHVAFINKDGYDKVTLRVKSLRVSGTTDYADAENEDSSPEDETDEMDGIVDAMSRSLLGKTRSDKVVIYWVSYLDHQQRVLLFTQDERIAKVARKAHAQGIDIPHERGVMKMNEAEQATLVSFVSLDGLTVSVINGAYEEVALLSMTSMPAAWEVEVNNRWKLLNIELQTWLEDQWRNLKTKTSLQEQVEVDLDQMKMLRPYIGDLRRTYNPGLWFSYRQSKHHVSFQAKIHRIQIDNQLSDAYFPTVLYPSPVPAYIVKKKGHKPFLEFCFMRRTVPENNVDTFRYIKLLMQEFNIRVDKGFLMSMYDVFSNLMPANYSQSFQLQADLVLAQRSLQDVAAVMVKDRPSWIFFEHLKLSPLKMHISFSLHGTVHESIKTDQTTIVSDIFEFFLSSVGATLTEMKEVELRMAYFERKGVFLSWSQLLSQVQLHYTQQAVQQVYVLILGLDVLGNPYGLLRDFTQGFGDLFYEPVLDSVQGSDQFADSLVRGVHSMLGNVIGGTASSLARITGSLGNALAVLSFDKSHKSRRRAAFQQRPSNLPLSLVLGGKSFVMGVCLGLSGVVLDPVRGAQEEGVEGFFKGVGKGIMGLLTKPTGGVLDMVSMAFDGMHRAAELEHGVIHRMRKPRFINQYLGLWPFSNHQAAGYSLLMNLNRGQFAQSDIYWAHAPLSVNERADVFLITDKNLVLLQKRRCWGGWEMEWVVKVEDLMGVPEISANKMILHLRQEENNVNLFAGGEREISSPDVELLQWIQSKIKNLLQFRQQFYC